jgi:hypothetical protein
MNDPSLLTTEGHYKEDFSELVAHDSPQRLLALHGLQQILKSQRLSIFTMQSHYIEDF